MSLRLLCLILIVLGAVVLVTVDVSTQQQEETIYRLDGRVYNPAYDADIDLYIRNWRDVQPTVNRGFLIERPVFTHGNPKHPRRTGEVLQYVNRFVYASLEPSNTTTPATLSGEQEILYITGGAGVLASKGRKYDLYSGVFALVPPNCEYTLTATGSEPLFMYIIAEPIVRDDFKSLAMVKTVDEVDLPLGQNPGHWSMNVRTAFNLNEELSIIEYVNSITFVPMTIGHPHAHVEKCEEVWTLVEGESILFIGKQIRDQNPGDSYLCPPYGNCTHSNINHSEKPIKFLYYAVRDDWTLRDSIKRSRDE
ncbi:AraC family ligand binding domain-containing protein [Candidatus Latescibacterota bacterium]